MSAGIIIAYAGPITPNPPEGWIECNGALLSTSGNYSKLFQAIQYTWSEGRTPPGGQFYIPDLRMKYLRGIGAHGYTPGGDDGSGISIPSVGTYQEDVFSQHGHAIIHTNPDFYFGGGSQVALPTNNRIVDTYGPVITASSNYPDPDHFSTNETRPKSYGIYWLISTS